MLNVERLLWNPCFRNIDSWTLEILVNRSPYNNWCFYLCCSHLYFSPLDKVFLCSLGWFWTHYVIQTVLELPEILLPWPPNAAMIGMCHHGWLVVYSLKIGLPFSIAKTNLWKSMKTWVYTRSLNLKSLWPDNESSVLSRWISNISFLLADLPRSWASPPA